MNNAQIPTFTTVAAVLILAIYSTVQVNPEKASSVRLLVPDQPEPDAEAQGSAITAEDPFSEPDHHSSDQPPPSKGTGRKQIATSGGPNPRKITWYFEGGSRTEEMDSDLDTPFDFENSKDE